MFYEASENKYNLHSSIADNNLIKINLVLSGKFSYYKRIYLPLKEHLVNVMSYLWNIFLLCYILCSNYNQFVSKRHITEKFFLFNKELKNSLRGVFKEFIISSDFKNRRSTRNMRTSAIKHEIEKSNESLETRVDNLQNLKENLLIDSSSLSCKSNNSSSSSHQHQLENQKPVKGEGSSIFQYKEKDNLELIKIEPDKDSSSRHMTGVFKSEESTSKIEATSMDNTVFKIEEKDIPYYNYKKNRFALSYITYISNKFFSKFGCCQKKLSKNYQLLDSTVGFYDYYLDINNYLKMMIEFDLVKHMLLNKRKTNMLSKFRPIISKRYKSFYQEKLENLYNEKFSNNDIFKIKKGMESLSKEKNIKGLASFAKYM